MAKRKPRKRINREKDFDKWLEKRAKEIAEEIEEIGQRFGVEMKRRAKRHEKGHEWKFEIFGPLGPLFGSAAGIIFIAIGIWLLNLVNVPLESSFISTVSNFLYSNLHWFFVVSLFFGYNDYFSKKFSKSYWLVSPIMTGIAIVIVAWILGWVFGIVSNYTDSSIFPQLSAFLGENLWGILVLVVVLGYVIVFSQKIVMRI
jgi:uncharacterized membrane protein